MIIIKQSSLNRVTTTLFELKTGSTSIFLCEFINNSSSQAFYCVATGLTHTNRYDAFCITDTGSMSANPLNSQVSLTLKGQYTYNIYENPNSSLSPIGLNKCEIGRLEVKGNDIITPAYSPQTGAVFYNS